MTFNIYICIKLLCICHPMGAGREVVEVDPLIDVVPNKANRSTQDK